MYGRKVNAKFPSDFYTLKKIYIYMFGTRSMYYVISSEKDCVREGRRGQGPVVEFHKGKRNKNKI